MKFVDVEVIWTPTKSGFEFSRPEAQIQIWKIREEGYVWEVALLPNGAIAKSKFTKSLKRAKKQSVDALYWVIRSLPSNEKEEIEFTLRDVYAEKDTGRAHMAVARKVSNWLSYRRDAMVSDFFLALDSGKLHRHTLHLLFAEYDNNHLVSSTPGYKKLREGVI